MCLLIKSTSGLNRAEEDIICYKVVKVDSWAGPVTPYQGAPIPENFINGEKPFIAKDYKGNELTEEAFERLRNYGNRIDGCAIHTFVSKSGAKADAREFRWLLPGNEFRVYKCIIPKGTPYYEGVFECIKSFASQKIVFKEKV